jgi:hypothetical protein
MIIPQLNKTKIIYDTEFECLPKVIENKYFKFPEMTRIVLSLIDHNHIIKVDTFTSNVKYDDALTEKLIKTELEIIKEYPEFDFQFNHAWNYI